MNLSYLHWACRYIQDLIIVVDIYRILSVATHACRQLRTNAVQTKISRLFFFRGRFCWKPCFPVKKMVSWNWVLPQDRYGTTVRYYWQTCRTTSLFPHYLDRCFAKHLRVGWERVDCCEERGPKYWNRKKLKCKKLMVFEDVTPCRH